MPVRRLTSLRLQVSAQPPQQRPDLLVALDFLPWFKIPVVARLVHGGSPFLAVLIAYTCAHILPAI